MIHYANGSEISNCGRGCIPYRGLVIMQQFLFTGHIPWSLGGKGGIFNKVLYGESLP